MIQTAKFTKGFFRGLVKYLKIYQSLFVVEDGNIYVKEKQAKDRIQSREKLARINGEDMTELRYAKVTLDNPPASAEELEEMFESQYSERRKAIKAAKDAEVEAVNTKLISDEEADALLAKKGKSGAPVAPKITIDDVEYESEAVKAAIIATVNPKFNKNTGYDKTMAAYEALSDEDKATVLAELKK